MRPASDPYLQIELGISLPRPQYVQLEDGAFELSDDRGEVDPLFGREHGRVDGLHLAQQALEALCPRVDGGAAQGPGVATHFDIALHQRFERVAGRALRPPRRPSGDDEQQDEGE